MFFFFKQKTAYEMRISDWSSDVCSSDLHAAFLIADIARRRADQPRNRVLLHEFAHVDAHHGAVIVEQEFGQRLGQFGLADARRSQEQETAERAIWEIGRASGRERVCQYV